MWRTPHPARLVQGVDVKAYSVTTPLVPGCEYYCGASRSQARAAAIRDLVGLGWARSWRHAMDGISLARCPSADSSCGHRPGPIGPKRLVHVGHAGDDPFTMYGQVVPE